MRGRKSIKDGLKRCPKCGESKPVEEYYKQPSNRSGLSPYCIPCQRVYNRERQRKNGATASRSKDRWREGNQHVYRAHRALRVALLKGRVSERPCEVCGAGKAHAHHDDYSKPLDVIWLCPVHHRERHAWLKEQGRDPATTTGLQAG